MRVKLRDLYNTRYFYITYQKDLVYLFSTILDLQNDQTISYNVGNNALGKVFDAVKVGAKLEFDLASTKITPDVLMTIKTYAEKGIVFVDTEDSLRDYILKENRRRMQIDTSDFVTLPTYTGESLVKEYIVSLDKNTKYKIPNHDEDIYIPLVYMIMVTRPKIVIDLGGQCTAFFEFVGSKLTVHDLNKYKEFYYTSPEGTMIVDFSNGDVNLQRIGYCNIERALTTGTLVPTVLGKERLLDEDCWFVIFRLCLNILNGYRATRKKTLSEVLNVEV